MQYVLNRGHFKTFQRAVGRYMTLYGLTDWQLEYHHEFDSSLMAGVQVTYEAHRADVYLSTSWSEQPTRERLYAKARHEVFHLFIAKLAYIAGKRYVAESEITEAEEDLVIRLQSLMPDL